MQNNQSKQSQYKTYYHRPNVDSSRIITHKRNQTQANNPNTYFKANQQTESLISQSLSSARNTNYNRLSNATVYIKYEKSKQCNLDSSRITSNEGESRYSADQRSEHRVQQLEKQLKSIRELKQKNERIYKNRISSLQNKLNEKGIDVNVKEEVEKLEKQLANAKEANQKLNKDRERLAAQNRELRTKLEQNERNQQSNILQKQLQVRKLEEKLNALKSQLSFAEGNNAHLDQELHRLKLELADRQEKLNILSGKQSDLELASSRLVNETAKLRQKINEQQHSLAQKNEQIEKVKVSCAEWIKELTGKIRQLEMSNSKLRDHKLKALRQRDY